MRIIRWISEMLSSPSGRASGRRSAFIWVVLNATLVATWAGMCEMDVKSGTLALFTGLLTATGAAVTAGRFAERGSEKKESESCFVFGWLSDLFWQQCRFWHGTGFGEQRNRGKTRLNSGGADESSMDLDGRGWALDWPSCRVVVGKADRASP